jgi:hypothetical protein
MNKKNRTAFVGVAALVLLACACPVSSLTSTGNEEPTAVQILINTPIPTTTPAIPTSAPVGEVLFTDDFSVESIEMESYSDENGSVETKDGVYVVRAISDLWHWGRSASQFDNTVIEVDVAMSYGPSNDNAGFGVVCRLSEREDTSIDGYMFAITADGYYTIRSITSSSMSPLVDYTFSSVINQGTGTNRIRATCNGDSLKFEVNGETVATATATLEGSNFGSIAFAAISFEDLEPIVEVHFDNLVVGKP